jgi:hypothetical protein
MKNKKLSEKRNRKRVRRKNSTRFSTMESREKGIYLARQKRIMETEGSQYGEIVSIERGYRE